MLPRATASCGRRAAPVSANPRLIPLRPIALAVCLLALAGAASAQDTVRPETAERRLGPISFNPGLVFSSGYDTNPWREAQKDAVVDVVESNVAPQVTGFLNVGRVRSDLFGAVEFVKAGTATKLDRNYQFGASTIVQGGRVQPFLDLRSRHTNANPTGFEVGRKSMRIENDARMGASFKVSSAVNLSAFYRDTQTNWDADALYQTSSLREKLNRTDTAYGGGADIALTPLTSVRASAEQTASEFVYSPLRNGRGSRLSAGLSFSGPAAITGNVDVGVRTFTSTSSGVSFKGPFSNVGLSHQFPTSTVTSFRYSRDLQFSYDTSLAYFVSESIEGTLLQAIGDNYAVQMFVGRSRLLYNPNSFADAPLNAVWEVNVAIGRPVSRLGRVGVLLERARADGRDPWNATRVGMFLTYGAGPFQRMDRPIPFQR
jgi:hypothetical protein